MRGRHCPAINQFKLFANLKKVFLKQKLVVFGYGFLKLARPLSKRWSRISYKLSVVGMSFFEATFWLNSRGNGF